jgi:hypothetical protein
MARNGWQGAMMKSENSVEWRKASQHESRFRGGVEEGRVKAKRIGEKGLLTKLLLAAIKDEGLPAPQLEWRFHSIRKWRFDAAWPDQMIAIEIHGGVYSFGHHVRGKGFEDDREKANEATVMGWRLLEYSTGQVKKMIPLLDLKRLFRGD